MVNVDEFGSHWRFVGEDRRHDECDGYQPPAVGDPLARTGGSRVAHGPSGMASDGVGELPLARAVLATHLMTVDHDDDLHDYRVVVRYGMRPACAIATEDDLGDYLAQEGYYRDAQRPPLRAVLDADACHVLPAQSRTNWIASERPGCGDSRSLVHQLRRPMTYGPTPAGTERQEDGASRVLLGVSARCGGGRRCWMADRVSGCQGRSETRSFPPIGGKSWLYVTEMTYSGCR
ncbi:hypothetical protein ACIRQO_36475 [Streptomyces anulatus]